MMEKIRKVKTAVIGCGRISNIYIRNLKKLFYITDLVAVCDISEEAAAHQAGFFGVDRVMTIDEIADSEEIELVVNLTPPEAHYGIIRRMLLAGKHVFTEKMMTTDLTEAQELVSLARERKLYLGSAPDTILGAGLQSARWYLDSGVIGDITSVQVCINRDQVLNSEMSAIIRQEGGALPYDVGIYYIGALIMLLGPVASLTASGALAPVHPAEYFFRSEPDEQWQIPGYNILAAALDFESGVIGSVLFDGNTVNCEQHRFAVFGTRGILLLGDPNTFNGSVTLLLPNNEKTVLPFTHGYNGKNMADEPRAFDGYGNRGVGAAEMAWAIRTGRHNNRCSMEYGLHCMEVLLGMDRSAGTGEKITTTARFAIDPLRPGYYSEGARGRGDAERSLME